MKISKIAIMVVLALSVGVYLTGCGKASEENTGGEKNSPIQDVTKGTSFQDHSEGKYGPPGAGGYGPDKAMQQAEEAAEAEAK